MLHRPYLVHVLSPLHCGTGQAADIIDLPIARLRSTRIPFLPGSSIKGVLREERRSIPEDIADYEHYKKLFGPKMDQSAHLWRWHAVFGPESEKAISNEERHAGALLVSDARLLALPVRSFKGVFAWVSSPLLLALAQRDLQCPDLPIPKVLPNHALTCGEKPLNVVAAEQKMGPLNVVADEQKIYLEDLDLLVDPTPEEKEKARKWADMLAPFLALSDGSDWFTNRLILVDDDVMSFLWDTATQVDTRIRIDQETRTVAEGALWIEESLPPETLLIGVLTGDKSRRSRKEADPKGMSPQEVLDFGLPEKKETILQFGGKATTGRGMCRMVPMTDIAQG